MKFSVWTSPRLPDISGSGVMRTSDGYMTWQNHGYIREPATVVRCIKRRSGKS